LSASTEARLGTAHGGEHVLSLPLRRAIWLVPVLSLVVVIGIFAPRFGVKSPSLVDDWFTLTYAPTATHQLLHGTYDPAAVDYGGRYRPSYALLGELQWMLGSRSSTLIPTIVGLLRLLFFVGVVASIVIAVLRGVASRTWLIVAASVVPMAVVATRGVSYNFVRFGVDEPTAFAAVAIGIIGMTNAIRIYLRAQARSDLLRPALIFAASYVVYVCGAYMSEACAAVVVLLPALYFWISREPDFVASRRSTVSLIAASVLILAPIAHVLAEVVPMLGGTGQGGRTVAGLAGQFGRPASSTVLGVLMTADLAWPIVITITLAITVRRALRRDRHAVLLAGMIASGFAAAYVANLGTSGNALSRYYIPLLVSIGVASMWLLLSLQPATRSVVLTLVLVIVLAGRGDVVARKWLDLDHAGDKAITFASEAYSTHCPVYLVDFPGERRMGLARMLNKPPGESLVRCSASSQRIAYTIHWQLDAPSGSPVYPGRCATRWTPIAKGNAVELARCTNFSPLGSARTQDTLTTTRIVRLVQPSHRVDASTLNRLAYVDG
jgi:hypothetical protein